jgi:hypothetical protein
MRYRPMDSDPADPRLGRFIPDDWKHVERHPLGAMPEEERPKCTPVVIGVDWYTEMFDPVQDSSGEYFVAPGGPDTLSNIEGGHCVCLEPGDAEENEAWWDFFNQHREGACVGFGWSRCMSLFNQELYAPRWLWDRSKEVDEWPQTNPGDNQGTSVRAGSEILMQLGHCDWLDDYADDDVEARRAYAPDSADGITAVRWTQSVDEVHATLGNERADQLGAVPFLNSWGRDYPYRTWMPDEVLAFLIEAQGEVAVPTDR